MPDDKAWAVTALVLQMNGIDPDAQLEAATASKIVINSELASRSPTLAPTEAVPVKSGTANPAASTPLPLWAIAGLAFILVTTILALLWSRPKARSTQE